MWHAVEGGEVGVGGEAVRGPVLVLLVHVVRAEAGVAQARPLHAVRQVRQVRQLLREVGRCL